MPDAGAAKAGRGAAEDAAAEDSELEERLTTIWRDELDITEVGPDDNFFDLGGQSVLLIRVHHRLTRELKRQIPIVSLFRYPTIRALAQHLSGTEERDGQHDRQGDLVAERRMAARQRLDSRRSLRRSAEPGPASGR